MARWKLYHQSNILATLKCNQLNTNTFSSLYCYHQSIIMLDCAIIYILINSNIKLLLVVRILAQTLTVIDLQASNYWLSDILIRLN